MDITQQPNTLINWKDAHSGGFKSLQRRIGEVEAAAKLHKSFQMSLVPGLLQTPEYANWVISGAGVDYSPARHLSEAVKARIRRQAILENPNKLFMYLIYEPALTRAVPGGIMKAQFEHLKRSMKRENIVLGVIPLASGLPVIPTNSFNIFDDMLVHAETFSEHLELENEWDVAVYVKAYEQLKDVALWDEEAERFLEDLARRQS